MKKKKKERLPENIYKDIVNNYYNIKKIMKSRYFNETFENEIIDTLEENQDEED